MISMKRAPREQVTSITCRTCGARWGELCSDVGVFVREDSFVAEAPKTTTNPPTRLSGRDA